MYNIYNIYITLPVSPAFSSAFPMLRHGPLARAEQQRPLGPAGR